MQTINYFRIKIILIILVLVQFKGGINAQILLDNIVVFNQNELYGDSISFESDFVLNSEHNKGSLFQIENNLNSYFKNCFFDLKLVNEKKYVDTCISLKIKGSDYFITAFWDSMPQGLWTLKDIKGKIRSEYFFVDGKNIFSNHYNEKGDLIRAFSVGGILNEYNVDKWFLDNKLIRVTYRGIEKFETNIYYPTGELMLKNLYDNKGDFKEGVFINIVDGSSSLITPLKMKK